MNKPEPIEPLPNDFIAKIGTLVRLSAELEDVIECYLFCLLGVTENQGKTLLGKATIGTKIQKLLYAAQMKNQEALEDVKWLNERSLRIIIETRNLVAHGVYMGPLPKCEDCECKPDIRRYAFMGNQTSPWDDEGVGASIVDGICDGSIESLIYDAEKIIEMFMKHPGVEGMREERLLRFQKHRRPHPKKQQPKGTKKRGN